MRLIEDETPINVENIDFCVSAKKWKENPLILSQNIRTIYKVRGNNI